MMMTTTTIDPTTTTATTTTTTTSIFISTSTNSSSKTPAKRRWLALRFLIHDATEAPCTWPLVGYLRVPSVVDPQETPPSKCVGGARSQPNTPSPSAT
jgi:hypothetical protein